MVLSWVLTNVQCHVPTITESHCPDMLCIFQVVHQLPYYFFFQPGEIIYLKILLYAESFHFSSLVLNLITCFVLYTNCFKWISPKTMMSEIILLQETVSHEGIRSPCDSEGLIHKKEKWGLGATSDIMAAH